MATKRRPPQDAGTAKQSGGYSECQFRSNKPWLDLQHYQDGTIKKPEELESKMKDPPDHIDSGILDRIHGSMIGMALGDALGAHVEFRSHEYMIANPVTTLKGGGTWGLEKGQFTDDTSMALCLANSLVARQDYVPYDQLVRYKWWYQKGYMSSTGKCFDIGSATRQSLEEFECRQQNFAEEYNIPFEQLDFLSDPQLLNKFDVNCSGEGVAGNGALMRLAPVPLFFYAHPVDAVKYSGLSGKITHGDEKAYDACRYYGALIVAAVNGATKDELIDKNFYKKHKQWFGDKSLHSDIMNITHGSYQKKKGYAKGIRGKGYIVSALEAALWAFWSDEDSFKKGVLAAVNLGDDTDTTAAIYGQLAGACYGYKNLPEGWVDQVYAKDFIECLSKWIAYEGTTWSSEASKTSNIPSVIVQSPPDAGSELSFEPDANLNEQSAQGKNPKDQLQSSTRGSATRLGLISTPEQFTDLPKDSRTRSRTFDDVFETLKPGSNEQYKSNRSTSANRRDQASSFERIYILKGLQSSADVCKWLRSLGDDYVKYEGNFQERNIDGYWLLNHVDDAQLTKYGVKNEEHRQVIFHGIEQLRNRCPERF